MTTPTARRARAFVAGSAITLATVGLGVTSSSAASPPRSLLPTHVNSCWASDNGDPVVDSFALSTHAVDVTDGPATITVTVRTHDEGGPGKASGISGVEIDETQIWADHDPQHGDVDEGHSLQLHRDGVGGWTGSLSVPQDSHAMTMTISAIDVRARSGPGTIYFPVQAGDDAVVAVTSDHPDVTPPDVTALTVSPDPVDVSTGPQVVHVTATTTAGGTPLTQVRLLAGQSLMLSPTGSPGEFAGDLTVTQQVGVDAIPMLMFLTDAAGNNTVLQTSDLVARSLPGVIHVVGAPTDTQRPTLKPAANNQRVVRVRARGGWWTVRLRGRDDASGLTPPVLHNGSGNPPLFAGTPALHLISGTPRDGVWGARIRIRHCAPSPGAPQVGVSFADRAGHIGDGLTLDPRLVGPDRNPPRTVNCNSGALSLAFCFFEPVHGISKANVVASTAPTFVHGVLTPHRVAGSWTCRSAHGPTSCLTGSVRRATFHATRTAPTYVDFAPSGRLGVLDRHGNPLRTAYDVSQND